MPRAAALAVLCLSALLWEVEIDRLDFLDLLEMLSSLLSLFVSLQRKREGRGAPVVARPT